MWSSSSPYLAVLWIFEGVTGQWQQHVSQWLIDTGCLYVLAWKGGLDVHGWEESLSEANKKAVARGKIVTSHTVVTTCYEYVALGEVIKFAEYEAVHPTAGRLPPFLILVQK